MTNINWTNETCPIHGDTMVHTSTRYGMRSNCSIEGCTMVGWSGGIPADAETRAARMKAHAAFDALWKSKQTRRNRMKARGEYYKALAEYLGLPGDQCHIKQFDVVMCDRVVDWVVWMEDAERR